MSQTGLLEEVPLQAASLATSVVAAIDCPGPLIDSMASRLGDMCIVRNSVDSSEEIPTPELGLLWRNRQSCFPSC